MKKRGQAATEFMMTYGWMIFVVIIVLGVLFGMGVFDIKLENSCYIPDPYKCLDVKFNSNDQKLTLKISASGIDKSNVNQVLDNPADLNDGIKVKGDACSIVGSNSLATSEDTPVEVSCDYSASGTTIGKEKKFEGTIKLQYKKFGGSNPHSVSGKFGGSAE